MQVRDLLGAPDSRQKAKYKLEELKVSGNLGCVYYTGVNRRVINGFESLDGSQAQQTPLQQPSILNIRLSRLGLC